MVALGVNTVVGAGIYRLPAELAAVMGPASFLAIPVCAVMLLAVALSFAEAGSGVDRGGGPYVYAREAFGPAAGFAVGWSMWAATALTLATVAAALPAQIAALLPSLSGPIAGTIIALTAIAGLGAVNVIGLRPAASLSNLLVVAKILPLLVFVAVGLFFVRGEHFEPLAPSGFGALPATLLPAFFVLSGFETATIPAGEAKRPRRDVPIAVVASVLGAAMLYALIQLVAVGVSPTIATSERPLVDAARVFLGDGGAHAIALAGVVSMLGLMSAMTLAGPRVLAALAEDGFVPRALAPASADETPRTAVALTAVAAAAGAVMLDFRSLVDFTSAVLVVQYVATCLAVPILRKRRAEPAPVRLPFGPAIPLAGAAMLLWVLAQTSVAELALAAAVLAAGVVIALAYRAARRLGARVAPAPARSGEGG